MAEGVVTGHWSVCQLDKDCQPGRVMQTVGEWGSNIQPECVLWPVDTMECVLWPVDTIKCVLKPEPWGHYGMCTLA